MLTPDMKRIIEQQRLGSSRLPLPTARPTSRRKAPSSCWTTRQSRWRDSIAWNNPQPAGKCPHRGEFCRPFVRKGYRFAGTARVVERGEISFDMLLTHFRGALAGPIRAIVAITVTKALPLTSPAIVRPIFWSKSRNASESLHAHRGASRGAAAQS